MPYYVAVCDLADIVASGGNGKGAVVLTPSSGGTLSKVTCNNLQFMSPADFVVQNATAFWNVISPYLEPLDLTTLGDFFDAGFASVAGVLVVAFITRLLAVYVRDVLRR